MARAVKHVIDAARHTALETIRDEEGKDALTSKVWARALAEDDKVADEVFRLGLETLGAGIGSVVNMLDLELIVVGRGIAEKLGQRLADRIAAAAAPWILQPQPELRFAAAALGDDSGLVCAASVGRAALITG